MNNVTKLHLIMGSMYSNKSTELIRTLLRYKAIGKNIFCINSTKDTRTPSNEIMTHDGISIPACKATSLLKDTCVPYNTHVIGIDEAQFFDDLVDFVNEQLSKKMIIIVAGLDGDYQQREFGDILKLIPIADSYQKVYSMCKICQDGTPGSFTKRITNHENQQILVGASEHYISVCRKHLT